MRHALILCLALLTAPAIAGDTFRFDRGVVAVGDTTTALMQRAGKPDRVVTLENKFGAATGERWEYYLRDKQVYFTIYSGRITSVDELR